MSYERFSVVISKEEESRAATGRAPRMPPDDGPVRRSGRGNSSSVTLEEFWTEVTEGRLGLAPVLVKTPAEVEQCRGEPAVLSSQLVSLPNPVVVRISLWSSLNYNLRKDLSQVFDCCFYRKN